MMKIEDLVLEKFGDSHKLVAVGHRDNVGPNGLTAFRVLKVQERKR